MSDEQKVLTVLKAAITRALGGEQVHGIHSLTPGSVELTIEPSLEYTVLDSEDNTRLAVTPFIMFPRTIVEQTTKKVTTWLASHRQVDGKISVGYAGALIEADAVYTGEVEPETSKPFIGLQATAGKGLQRIIADNVGIKILMEDDSEGQLTVNGTGSVLIDHSNNQGRCYIGLLYFGMTPLSTDTLAVGEGIEDLGYLPLTELSGELLESLTPWSKLVVAQLLANQEQHNNAIDKA